MKQKYKKKYRVKIILELAILIFILLIIFIPTFAQEDESDFGFVPFKISGTNDTIYFNVYAPDKDFRIKKYLFIYIAGSGPSPAFQCYKKSMGSTLIIKPKLLRDKYYFVVLNKPGVPFFSHGDYNAPKKYYECASLDYYVQATSDVINYLVRQKWIDKNRVVVCGDSEGSDIAAKVADVNNNVTHLGCFVGGGLTQMYDFIINVRKKVAAGNITAKQGEEEISNLYDVFKKIYADPKSTNKFWEGHTYLRWSTFFNSPPLESLLKIIIPIYIVQGTKDTNGAVEGSDIIPLEFIRQGKTNLTYKVYPNYDHQFQEQVFDSSGKIKTIDRIEEVIKDFIMWLNSFDKNKQLQQ